MNVLTRFFLLVTAMSLLSACASFTHSQGEKSAAKDAPSKVLNDFCTPALATKGHC